MKFTYELTRHFGCVRFGVVVHVEATRIESNDPAKHIIGSGNSTNLVDCSIDKLTSIFWWSFLIGDHSFSLSENVARVGIVLNFVE